MSAQEQMKAMLDELMGTGRDGENNKYKVKFDDNRVCKSFLLSCCPHDILSSTRMDLGDCAKIHDLALRADYEIAAKGKDYYYDIDAMEHLQSFIADCDRKTEMAKKRLKETQEELSEEANEKADAIHQLGEKIGITLAGAEAAGAEGNVEESLKLMQEVEDLKVAKEHAETEFRNTMPASSYQQQKLRVCEVCSAYLGIHDNDKRLADHFGGKLHLGFITIRDNLVDLQKKVAERRTVQEKEREARRARDKQVEEDRAKEREEREKEREKERERMKKEREKERRRSRSRSRHRRSKRSRSRSRDRRRKRSRSGNRRRSRSRSKDRQSKKRSHRSRSRSRSRRSRSRSRSRSYRSSRSRRSRSRSRDRRRSNSRSRHDRSYESRSKNRSRSRSRSKRDRKRTRSRSREDSKQKSRYRSKSRSHSPSTSKHDDVNNGERESPNLMHSRENSPSPDRWQKAADSSEVHADVSVGDEIRDGSVEN